MANLYSNENVAIQVVEHLRVLGHDVLTSKQDGNANLGVPDEQVLAFANNQARIIVTNNRRDFIRLHRDAKIHCGILIYTQDDNFEYLAYRIDGAVKAATGSLRPLIRVTKAGFAMES